MQSKTCGSKTISSAQIIALRTAAAKVFQSDDEYHDWLAQNFDGICRTKNLSQWDASQAIDLLRRFTGYKPPNQRKIYKGSGRKGSAANRITQQQAAKIGALCELLGWHERRGSLLKFIERQTGKKTDVQMLLNYEAQKLIVGMQRIIAGKDDEIYRFLNTLQPGDIEMQAVQNTLQSIKTRLHHAG